MLPIEEISQEIEILLESLDKCKNKINTQRLHLLGQKPKNLSDFHRNSFLEKRRFCLEKIDQVLMIIDNNIEKTKITDFNVDRYKMEKISSSKEAILNIINNDITDIISSQLHIGEIMSDVNDLLSLIDIITEILSKE